MKNAHALSSVAEVMREGGVWWAVAGGWAIDLWLGDQTRDHHDIEVVVRRCDQAARITRPVTEVTKHSASGVPIVRPEVQLLYMAKAMEAKNVHDFDKARPRLDHDAAAWLADALSITLPDHQWIKALRS